MRVNRAGLPVGCAYWPVLPGEYVDDGNLVEFNVVNGQHCGHWRGGWICTRPRYHLLPHVAMNARYVVAVWDQSWYLSDVSTQVSPVDDVRSGPS